MRTIDVNIPRKVQRFCSKIEMHESGCWIWRGSTSKAGYGQFDGTGAHRWSFQLAFGTLKKAQHLDHKCRVRNCVNPFHLERVTQRENIVRGLIVSAQSGVSETCKRGHNLTGSNLAIDQFNNRYCKACAELFATSTPKHVQMTLHPHVHDLAERVMIHYGFGDFASMVASFVRTCATREKL